MPQRFDFRDNSQDIDNKSYEDSLSLFKEKIK